jgi:hypothetical protein
MCAPGRFFPIPWRDHLLPPKIFFNQRRLANESDIQPTNAL